MNEEFENMFDDWFVTEMLPAEVDDDRIIVGLRLAYLAGAAAMRERRAEVAESDDTCECGCSSDYECNHCAIKKNIAAAIRKIGT